MCFRKGYLIMMKDKHGIKDKVAGKFIEGKAQQAKGKVKSKATKVKEDLE